jgi:hypothetical protein
MCLSQIVLQIERLAQKRLGRLEPARLQESDRLPQCFPRTGTLRGSLRRKTRRLPTPIRGATPQQPSEQAEQHDIVRNT